MNLNMDRYCFTTCNCSARAGHDLRLIAVVIGDTVSLARGDFPMGDHACKFAMSSTALLVEKGVEE